MPTRKLLNVGLVPNDGKGDTLRDAAEKIEYNFGLLFDDKEVQNGLTTGSLSPSGLSIFASASVTLLDGTDAGERKDLVNESGTSTVAGTFQNGTTLTMSTPTACSLVWTGSAWALFSDTGISVT